MDCILCKKPIEDYNPIFNHLKIDDDHSADICLTCIDKFSKWQFKVLGKLFPSSAMKKRLDRH